jgi:predicted Zn-dependent protease
VSTEPASINREFAEAMSALQAGKLADAERLCKAVLRAEPKHVETLNLLGVVLGRLGRNAEAIASFDSALDAAPDSIEAWYGRGMTLAAMNRPQQAIKSFDRVLAAEPDFSQVQLLRAKLLMEFGRRDTALEGLDNFVAPAWPRPGSAAAMCCSAPHVTTRRCPTRSGQ